MTLQNTANENMAIAFDLQVPPAVPAWVVPSDLVYGGDTDIADPGITATVSTVLKTQGDGVCTDKLVCVWAVAGKPCPYSSTLYDFIAGASTISATAVFSKSESKAPMRVGDASTCIGTWKLKASPYTVETCTCDAEISDADQTKAKAQ